MAQDVRLHYAAREWGWLITGRLWEDGAEGGADESRIRVDGVLVCECTTIPWLVDTNRKVRERYCEREEGHSFHECVVAILSSEGVNCCLWGAEGGWEHLLLASGFEQRDACEYCFAELSHDGSVIVRNHASC